MKNFTFIAMTIAACLFMSGCNQINDAVNGSKPANTNSATNSNSTANSNASTNANANTNANSNVTSNANANNQTAEKSPEIKAFENNLIGTWVDGVWRRVFTKDHYIVYADGKIREYFPYRILDKETVEILSTSFGKDRIKITFKNNNSTLDWRWTDGNGFGISRESDKTDVIADDSLDNKLIGAWVGISGTNSDKEKFLFYIDAGSNKNKLFSISNGGSSGAKYTVQENKTVVLENGSKKTVSVEGNVLTVEENGVTKKYNRQTTVD